MWDALETLHEGTDEVKQSKINTLVQQYELFCMTLVKQFQTKIVLIKF